MTVMMMIALLHPFLTWSLNCQVWAEEKAGDQQWEWSCGGQKAKWTKRGSQQVSGDGAFGEQGAVRDHGPVYDNRRDAELAEWGREDWGVIPTPWPWI